MTSHHRCSLSNLADYPQASRCALVLLSVTSRILRSGVSDAIIPTVVRWGGRDVSASLHDIRAAVLCGVGFLATTLAAGLFFGGARYRVVSLRSTTRHYPATRSPRVEITPARWIRWALITRGERVARK